MPPSYSVYHQKMNRTGPGGWNQPGPTLKGATMLGLAIALLVLALIAAVLGFGGIAGTAAGFAKIAFIVFLVLAIIGFFFGRRPVA